MEEDEKRSKQNGDTTDSPKNNNKFKDSRQSFKDRINRDDVNVKLSSKQWSCLSQKRAYKDRIVERTEAKHWSVPKGSVQSRTFNKLQEMLDTNISKEGQNHDNDNNNMEGNNIHKFVCIGLLMSNN